MKINTVLSSNLNRRFIGDVGISLLLGISILLLFDDVSSFDFITLDDYTYIVNNPIIQKGLSIEGIKWAFSGSISMYIPLTFISYMIDWQIHDGFPGGFHFTNMILHVFNSILLFMVLRKYTQTFLPCVFVSFLFAFHPIHVESVAWVSERKDVLSTFFFLISLLFYHRQLKTPNTVNSTLLNLFFLMGLLSKPMLVTFPFVLLLFDFWPLHRYRLGQLPKKEHNILKIPFIIKLFDLIREKTSLFLLTCCFSAFTVLAQRAHGGLVSFQVLPFHLRLENALISYAVYIQKLFWPVNLAVFYPHPMDTISIYALVVSALLLSVITAGVIISGKNHPYLPMGWFLYLGTMIPVVGISQSGMQALADRFAYIPFIGLYIMVAWGVFSLINKLKFQYNYFIYAGMILLTIPLFAFLTHGQLSLWRNSETLYEHTLNVTHNNYIIHYAMADIQYNKGNLQEAKKHLNQAIQIEPSFTNAILKLGKIYQTQGEVKKALKTYYQVLEIKPDNFSAHKQLGYLWLEVGVLEKAVLHMQNAVSIKPGQAKLYNDIGVILLYEKKAKKAIFYLNKAITLKPNNAEYQKNYQKALRMASTVD